MDEAAIYTIHGFCQRVLSEFAFNSGQQFRLEVLADDGDLWHRAIQDWWRRTGYPLNTVQARLFRDSLGDLEAFEALVKPLRQRRRLLPEVDGWDRCSPLGCARRRLRRRPTGGDGAAAQVLRESKGLSRAQASPYRRTGSMGIALLDDYFARPREPPDASPC
jgi:exodeoxyribonuclease V beta subunit